MFDFDTIAKVASAAVCSLILTAVSVGAAVDGHAAAASVQSVYASAANGDSANG